MNSIIEVLEELKTEIGKFPTHSWDEEILALKIKDLITDKICHIKIGAES